MESQVQEKLTFKAVGDFIQTYTDLQMKMLGTSINKKMELMISENNSTLEKRLMLLQGQVEMLKVSVSTEHNITINLGEPHKVEGILHKAFDECMIYLSQHEPVYLHGPAGSGKNVLAEQCAKALGVEFYSASTLLQKYELLGYGDANGNYRSTSFYKAFCNGGLFFLDEFDGCSPEVAIALNGALANFYEDFPIEGFKFAAKNFYCIAAGNTVARGANELYNGRFQLDAATIDRFSFVEVDYDERIELQCARGDKELVTFIHQVREAAKIKGIQLVAGYRAIKKIAKFYNSLPLSKVLEGNLFKGLDKEDRYMLSADVESGKYYQAMRY